MRNILTDTPIKTEERASEKRRLNNTQLSELYPTPKTPEERMQEQNDREIRRLTRQPRYLVLAIATRLFFIATLASMLFTLAPSLVAWNVISGVFNLVLCVFILLGIIKWQTAEISSALYNKGLNNITFLTLYLVILAPLVATALFYTNKQAGLVLVLSIYASFYLIHFLCIRFLIRFLDRQ
jgi:small-conductance mechanosensitive channel